MPDLNLNTPDEGLLGNTLATAKPRGKKKSSFEAGTLRSESLKTFLDRRRGQLDVDRKTWFPNWTDLANNFLPFRGRYMAEANDTNKGYRRNYAIINEAPLIAARTFAAGLLAGSSSPSRPWLRLAVRKELMQAPGVKEWLFETTETMLDIFAKSNLYNSLEMCYREFGVFGIFAMLLEEDDDTVINTQPFTIMSYYVAQNKRRMVDTFFRDFEWTIRQVVQRFATGDLNDDDSWKNISLRTRAAFQNSQFDTLIPLCHAVYPNENRQKDAKGRTALGAEGMAYRSVYYERGGDPQLILEDSAGKTLKKGGYRDFPIICARCYTNSEDTWGRGPAMDALGSARALQLQEKRLALAIDKMVDPPMRGDPRLKFQRTSTLPGDTTWISSQEGKVGFEPLYEVKPDVTALRENIDKLENKVDTIMFSDLFAHFIQDQPGEGKQPVTAEQIQAENQEKLLMLGPVLESLNYEGFNPLVRRSFGIMMRRGLVGKIPDVLKGEDITVDYISVLHQAQKALSTGAIDQFLNFVGRIAQTEAGLQNAPALDKVNFDEMVEEYGEAIGTPPSVIYDDDTVAKIRAQRAQQQQQQQQAAQMQQEAQAAQKGGQAVQHLASSPVGGEGGGSALDALLGGLGGGGQTQ